MRIRCQWISSSFTFFPKTSQAQSRFVLKSTEICPDSFRNIPNHCTKSLWNISDIDWGSSKIWANSIQHLPQIGKNSWCGCWWTCVVYERLRPVQSVLPCSKACQSPTLNVMAGARKRNRAGLMGLSDWRWRHMRCGDVYQKRNVTTHRDMWRDM